MKKRRYSKIKKNLLVRLIRWVYNFFDTLFKRKKSTFRATYRRQLSSDQSSNVARVDSLRSVSCPDDRSISVGELFDRVKWQFSEEPNIQEQPLSSRIPQPHDLSRN